MGKAEEIDVVGDGLIASNARWSFGGAVSDNFDTHVQKSVPFYNEGHELIHKLSDFFINEQSICYEIGCSTSELLRGLGSQHDDKHARFIGIEIDPDMCIKSVEKCVNYPNVKIIEADATAYDFEKADLIISYYTIQFLHPRLRQQLMSRIYESLNWGGAFIMFEKVRAPDARFQDIMSQIYVDFKIKQGYSPAEIIGKTRSLKGVLEPFSTRGNLDLLQRAGFEDVMTIMKNFSFEGFLAIK